MNDEIYNVALRNALNGIKDALSDLNWSFILMNDGTVITSGEDSINPAMEKAARSFQSLAEKATVIGGMDNMLISGDKCKVYVSSVDDMYLVAGLAKNADLVYFRAITHAVLPTVLKVLESVTPSLSNTPTPFTPESPIPFSLSKSLEPPLAKSIIPQPTVDEDRAEEEEQDQSEEIAEVGEAEELQAPELSTTEKTEVSERPEELPSQQLIVDRFSGFMVKSDTIQLDAEILKRWSEELGVEGINEVEIETFSGRNVRCKTKVINDPKLEGRGLIRIPEKTCQSLDVRRGELVRVKAVAPQESD